MQTTTDPVLEFIGSYTEKHHIPPSVREIAAGCYLSSTATSYRIHKLAKQGFLTFEARRARSIRLISSAER